MCSDKGVRVCQEKGPLAWGSRYGHPLHTHAYTHFSHCCNRFTFISTLNETISGSRAYLRETDLLSVAVKRDEVLAVRKELVDLRFVPLVVVVVQCFNLEALLHQYRTNTTNSYNILFQYTTKYHSTLSLRRNAWVLGNDVTAGKNLRIEPWFLTSLDALANERRHLFSSQ